MHEETRKVELDRPLVTQDAYLHVLLRKTWKGSFRAPADCVGWPPVPSG